MGLVDIKTRIEVASSTRKITQALQLVAANKMKFYQRQAMASREYVKELVKVLGLASDAMEFFWLAENREEGKTLFVLMTSNKGLCGTMNAKVVNHLFASDEWNSLPPEQRLLATVGRKGRDVARRLKIPVEMEFPGIGENLKPIDSLTISSGILDLWEAGTIRKVLLVSPHYVNPFTNTPTIRPFLPLSQEIIEAVHQSSESFHGRTAYLEPDGKTVVRQIAIQIIESLMTQAFYDLKASEYSSRMVAMKKASDAADEMTTSLTLEYNRTRQSIITQSLAELAAASEAMSDEVVLQDPEEVSKKVKAQE